ARLVGVLARRRLSVGLDRDELRLRAVELQRRQPAAPDAAGVDYIDAEPGEAAERRPVPADDADVALVLARHLVPRIEPRPLRARRLLLAERDAGARVAVPHAREHVDARAQPIDAAKLRVPHVGLVAEE